MKALKFLRSNFGFSMVEVTVAMGLLGIATLAVMNLADNVNTSSKRAETMLNKSQFASALGGYMYSSTACNEFVTKMSNFGATPIPMVIKDWKVAGANDPTGALISDIGAGKKFKNFTLKTLDGTMDVTTASLPKVTINGVQHIKTFLNVMAVIETNASNKDESDPSGKREYSYFFNIPVLATAAGKVAFCSEEKNIRETCVSMKGTYDPATGKCDLEKTCKIQGTYRVLTCDYTDCSTAEGPTQGNPLNGNAVGCPTGTPIQTGYKAWTSQAPCTGKKCTPIDVHNVMNWYSCLECPP